jgi:hypothetical protein
MAQEGWEEERPSADQQVVGWSGVGVRGMGEAVASLPLPLSVLLYLLKSKGICLKGTLTC